MCGIAGVVNWGNSEIPARVSDLQGCAVAKSRGTSCV